MRVFIAAVLVTLLGLLADVSSAQPVEAPRDPSTQGNPPAGTPESGAPEAAAPTPGNPHAGSPQAGNPRADNPRGANPHAGNPHSESPTGGPAPIGESRPSAGLPAGSVQVTVVDARNQPVAGATVRLGTMAQGGERTSQMAQSDATGRVQFNDLPTGSSQAYRANVHFDGVTYSAMPFRLESDRGQDVRIRQLPVSSDARLLVQLLGQTMLEYRDERIHVSQQARLMNVGQETYRFPEEGIAFRLPRGFKAFQSEPVMSDQRITPNDDGFVIRGSLPPGQVALNWAYDLPLESGDVVVSHPIPIPTFRYRVISDAGNEMTLSIDDFPEAELREVQGRNFLVSEFQRRPSDPPLERVRIRIEGIPGPGPLRWIAVGASLVLAFLGFMLAFRGGDLAGALAEGRKRRRTELLDEIDELEQLFSTSEIGPRYREKRLKEITEELASLLRLDDVA